MNNYTDDQIRKGVFCERLKDYVFRETNLSFPESFQKIDIVIVHFPTQATSMLLSVENARKLKKVLDEALSE